MNNGITIVRAEDIKDEMMLTFQFTHHPVPPGQPSPFHKHFCSKCFGTIAHSIGTGDYTPVIESMSDALLDHLADFLATAGEHKRCDLLKAQREDVTRSLSPAQLAASRAEYLEVIEARHYGFDITSQWGSEREDWLEAKENLRKATDASGIQS